MKNNYIITIDLHKLYNKSDNVPELYIADIDKFTSLVSEYYMIDNYNFEYTNNDIFKNYVIDKYDVDIVVDKFKLHKFNLSDSISNKYNSGIILFDLSMIDDKFKNILNDIMSNYENIFLNKLYDNYLLHFNNLRKDKSESKSESELKSELKLESFNKFYNLLINEFTGDIEDIILYQKIKNLPKIIDNDKFTKKIDNDINYIDDIKQNIYTSFYSEEKINFNNDIINYEKELIFDLNNNYSINYNITDNDHKYINPENYIKALNKLKNINDYLDLINVNLKDNNKQNLNRDFKGKFINEIFINDIFNIHKLNNLFSSLSYDDIIYNMNDICDKKIKLYTETEKKENKNIDNNLFINQNIHFLNEFIKRKIKKIIKSYNYLNNKLNINNNTSLENRTN
jgi:hypothetical protein